MSQARCKAWLGPRFDSACEGEVHSVFDSAVNLSLSAKGARRLVTLIPTGAPRVPDGAYIPIEAMRDMRAGMYALLDGAVLRVGERRFKIERDASWDGRIPVYEASPRTAEFLRITRDMPCGFDRLPESARLCALSALGTPEMGRYTGLGYGLTPSYDDACVGFMAVCRAAGRPAGFAVSDGANTTDVSLRYLLLACEGRYGELICRAAAALFGRGSLEESVRALEGVGATSGRDTLLGMRVALDMYYNAELNI